MNATFVDEAKTTLGVLMNLDPWAVVPEPVACECGTAFVVITPAGIRSPGDGETCLLCRGKDVADAQQIPIEHEHLLHWVAERQALVRMAERIAKETGLAVSDVQAELMGWEQAEGFRVLLHKISTSAPTRQAAWDAAMRIWIQGPDVAASESLLVARLSRRKAGLEIDPMLVDRVTARLEGMKVLEGPIADVARSMLHLMEQHGRDLVVNFKMKDGSKQRWRGNGVRLA